MCLFAFIVIALVSTCVLSQENEYPTVEETRVLGAIIYEDDYIRDVLDASAAMYNFNIITKEVSQKGKIIEISQYVCELASKGVLGIIDGLGGRDSENIQVLADALELPHIMIQHSDLYDRDWSLLNFYPSRFAYNAALKGIVLYKDWKNFTILYVKGQSILRVSDLLEMGNHTDRYTIAIRELSGSDYRDVLINSKKNGYTNFVVDCPSSNIDLVLDHAQQVGLMADEHSYIFVSPDLFTKDLVNYRYGGVNITGLRLVNLTDNVQLWNFTDYLYNQTGQQLPSEHLSTKVVLIHDVVLSFSSALEVYTKRKLNHTMIPIKLNCEDMEPWKYGTTLLNFMRTHEVDGITGKILFDGQGLRSKVIFDVLELTPAGNESIGQWKFQELSIDRVLEPDAEIGEENVLNNKTLKVLIAKTPPYAYEKESEVTLVGNDRYEGFTIDLIDMLSKELGFNYVYQVQPTYGTLEPNGSYSGMVKDLREDLADLAITDLTITKVRQEAIDFSVPFMTLGISILYKEPSKLPPEMFSFMAVFSKEVWLYMMLIQFFLGVLMIFVGRISNKEWQNPVPCVEQPDELSNQFSFANSVWLIIGSVMQQGSEIAPIALAPRLITSVWWFFTLVMVASYCGTLVVFLTNEPNVFPFQTIDELYNAKSIKYGLKSRGSTLSFFNDSKNPIYHEMYTIMEKNGWIVNENDDGVRWYKVSDTKVAVNKVVKYPNENPMNGEILSWDLRPRLVKATSRCENSNYAFFMESTSIEYYKERHCDLIQVGGLLDTKTYGIGMKKKSPYKKYIDDVLLKFKEQGDIQKLKDLWWKEKRGGGKCQNKQDEEKKQLDMKNMVGAFVVLGVGCAIGIVISILDMMWGVFKRSVKYGTTFKFELIEELKFAVSFSGNVKPVKRSPKTIEGSAEALAELEGKDEIRSLKSLGSGKSTSTHKTTHSHSTRHSSRSLSVAFARRRKYS